jgi:hypothetical protein
MPLRRNRLVAWIAAFAVVVQALWPLLAHARPKDPSLLVPVCTIDGITHFLEIKTGKTPLDERTALHGDHCKLCVFGAQKVVALTPQNAVAFLASDAIDPIAISQPVSFSEPASHPSAQPRAPPDYS